ncbi:glycosyltransferase N-terminal domain-containing protein [Roseicyclus sp. F158]|uniref:3-deoxy-D-manno-octulosonic acid transferase n=1 Tax=Tropicimonas omnivorans TaxID=3075590 RepID=A0ABU3DDM7_9RHOB|nr:glycosyltransferase N-terminal domain-containing protein [Roseicyclus sp. F158]MDT0681830.1 glycosyltransferase N-terminal domain-containing protein [Roseicyclus sp. F158]
MAGFFFGRGRSPEFAETEPPRPRGVIVWVHAPGALDFDALAPLAERLDEVFDGCTMLITSTEGHAGPVPLEGLVRPVPQEGREDEFIAHWSPDMALWMETPDDPALLAAAARAAVPLVLVGAAVPPPATGRARRVQRATFDRFGHILASSPAAADAILGLAPVRPRVEVTGPLIRLPDPPPCSEGERSDFAALLATRPVWLALEPAPSELPGILAAHRFVLTHAHRLLLIVLLPEEGDADAAAELIASEGWSHARRSLEEEPGERTEVYLIDTPGEIGLWVRIAPVTFLGGTLAGGPRAQALAAASLGSALIAGQEGRGEDPVLRRLTEGGALHRISGPADLGLAVDDLLSPERSAVLAHNAWVVATDGAEVIDRLAALAEAALRKRRG